MTTESGDEQHRTPSGPLAGVRVADFTHILAGPFCTQLLADAGADVIKVEPPHGEYARVRGALRHDGYGHTLSSFSAAVNRGKRSLSLDLKSPGGHAIAGRLIESADVVVENFAPGTMERLGFGSSSLREVRPDLITASISLWGVDSAHPLASRGGLAIVAEAESGLMDMIRDVDGRPVAARIPLGDMSAGLAAYAAIVTALYERRMTGVGAHIPISMVATLLSFNSIAITYEQMEDAEPLRAPAGMGVFPTQDGEVCFGVNSDRLWGKLVQAIGRPELQNDPRFAQYQDREARRDEANAIVTSWTSAHTTEHVVETVAPTGVPCGRIATGQDVLSGGPTRELGLFQTIDDGMGGHIEAPLSPLKQRQASVAIPRLGEHNHEITVGDLGLTEAEYEHLGAAGAFGS